MKNSTQWRWSAFIMLVFASMFNSSLYAQCSYELSLDDSYGDGWNGNTIDVRVGATTTNYTLSNGFDTTIVLTVNTGDTIQLTYYNTGLYQSEVSFELFDPNQTSIYASGQGPSAGLNLDTTGVCPTCPAVTQITLDSATSSSVSVSWAAVGAASGYQLEWGPCGFIPGTGMNATTANTYYTITGLAPSQCVDVYITTDCTGGGGGYSNQTGPSSFTSLQPVIDSFPFFTNFEANNGYFLASGSNASWQWGSPAGTVISSASSGSNAWVTNLSGNYNNSENSFLTSSVFDLSNETGSFILSFDLWYVTENNYDEAWVEMTTDGINWTKVTDNGTAVGWYNDLGNQWWENTNSGWTATSIILSNIAGQSTVQFRFAFSSDGSVSREGVAVDDFRLEELTCGVPSAFATTFVTSDSAGFSWTTSSGYSNIEYGVAGFTQGSGTMILGATGADTITGLMAGTSYEIYIQDSCAPGAIGLWVGPYTITTQQATVNTFPYTEDFETTSGGWIQGGNNSSWAWGAPAGTVISGAGQGTNAWVTNLTGDYNNSELSYLQSVIFDCSGNANDLQYTFSMNFETENNYDEGWVEYSFDGTNWTKLLDAGSAIGWYNDLGNQWWEDDDGLTWTTRYNIIPGSAGQSYVQIRHVFSSDGSVTREGFGIDDITVDPLSCAVPSGLTAANLTPFTADLLWNSTGNNWNVEWGPAGFVAGTGQGNLINTTVDSVSITGLMANTCYDFYVQDSCSGGNSAWIGPFNFCTPPTCPAPTNLGVNSVDTATATLVWDGNNLPGNYIIEYGQNGFQQGSGTVVTTTADSLPLTGLTNATNYCFYVQELCSSTDTSAWAGPFCFTTLCGNNIPGDGFNNPIIANGPIVYGGSTSVCYTNQNSSRGSVDVIFQYTPSSGTTAASFESCGSSYDTYLYLLDANQVQLTSNDDACGLQSQIMNYAVTPGTTYYLVLESFSTSTTGNFTITITETNPCPAPTNLMTSATSCTELDLIWNNGGASTSYEVEYGATGFAQGSGTSVLSNDTTELISGLSPLTDYDVYVRGFCSGDTSTWVGPMTFSTDSAITPVIIATASIVNVSLTDASVFLDASNTVADSINWEYGDTITGPMNVSGDTATVTYYANDSWPIVVTAYNNCGSTTDTIYVTVASIGIAETSINYSFRVFPNPSTGLVTVSVEEATASSAQVQLMDLRGRVLETVQLNNIDGTREIQMDLSDLPKGVYILKYRSEATHATSRVVLQ